MKTYYCCYYLRAVAAATFGWLSERFAPPKPPPRSWGIAMIALPEEEGELLLYQAEVATIARDN